ncbi:hypothetical protein [Vreelandella nanhaiensis]|uniref:hypothetical protein n=1 Tax=Vreelandella nanhaiensis TaxID=1258546 RepID=UPI00163C272B|nr:hypothetical protein [Halomonas nanhaiensis]
MTKPNSEPLLKAFFIKTTAGKLIAAFRALTDDLDVEWLFIDGFYVKAHHDFL